MYDDLGLENAHREIGEYGPLCVGRQVKCVPSPVPGGSPPSPSHSSWLCGW